MNSFRGVTKCFCLIDKITCRLKYVHHRRVVTCSTMWPTYIFRYSTCSIIRFYNRLVTAAGMLCNHRLRSVVGVRTMWRPVIV